MGFFVCFKGEFFEKVGFRELPQGGRPILQPQTRKGGCSSNGVILKKTFTPCSGLPYAVCGGFWLEERSPGQLKGEGK
jgi:hypothetical protein